MTTTVAMTKPVVTHVISSTVAPSAPVRCGVATATIEVSMAPMSVPNVTDSVTTHLLTGARAYGAGNAETATVTPRPSALPARRRTRRGADRDRTPCRRR